MIDTEGALAGISPGIYKWNLSHTCIIAVWKFCGYEYSMNTVHALHLNQTATTLRCSPGSSIPVMVLYPVFLSPFLSPGGVRELSRGGAFLSEFGHHYFFLLAYGNPSLSLCHFPRAGREITGRGRCNYARCKIPVVNPWQPQSE